MKPYNLVKSIKGFIGKVDYHIHKNGHRIKNWWEGEYDGTVSRGAVNQQIKKEIESEIIEDIKYGTFEQQMVDCFESVKSYRGYDENWTGHFNLGKPATEVLDSLQFILDVINDYYRPLPKNIKKIDTSPATDNSFDVTLEYQSKTLLIIVGYRTGYMEISHYINSILWHSESIEINKENVLKQLKIFSGEI